MTNSHPDCYGMLLTNLLDLPEDRPASGNVFAVLSTGGRDVALLRIRHGRHRAK